MDTAQTSPPTSHDHATLWRQAGVRLLPSIVVAIAGAILASSFGSVGRGDLNERLLSLLGVVVFTCFAVIVLLSVTKTLRHVLADTRLSTGHTAVVQFVVRIVGYVVIFLEALNLLGVSVGSLIVGGAALGIILGVAAQQALSNIFAIFVLMVARPFAAGDRVTINAGGFGRAYSGQLKEVGLTHTRLKEEDGTIVLLPNSALLQWAAISPQKSNRGGSN